jgi:hypothetical protein
MDPNIRRIIDSVNNTDHPRYSLQNEVLYKWMDDKWKDMDRNRWWKRFPGLATKVWRMRARIDVIWRCVRILSGTTLPEKLMLP